MKGHQVVKRSRVPAAERQDVLERLSHKLRHWRELSRDVKVPGDFVPALSSGRPELLRLAQPRALNVEECGHVFELIAVLIETNALLQEHAREVAHMSMVLRGQINGTISYADRLRAFGNFERMPDDEEY